MRERPTQRTQKLIKLAGLFTAESSAYMDYNTYLSCLVNIGYNPASSDTGSSNDNGYYSIGFSAAYTPRTR